jgi:apolipoprotein N-acyltransferase
LNGFRFTAWGRYGAAAMAGVCLAFAFPKPGIAGLAWLAPALMLGAAMGTRGWERFRIGYVAGLAHYLTSLAWLLHMPVTGYPILGWVALSSFLALFPATWIWIVRTAGCERRGADGTVTEWHWARRAVWAATGAAAWVTMEMILARVFGGFPWNFLGASHFQLLPLIQVASVTGIYGVSFLVVWMSLALCSAAHEILRQPTNRLAWLGEVILPAIVVVAVFVAGMRMLREQPNHPRELRVTFIQPSIPQTLIWDPNENTNRFRQLLDLSAAALTNETDLLLWPEAAVPDMVRYDEPTREAVARLASSNRVWMIIGSDDAALRPGGTTEEDVDYFNAALLINPAGEIAASYRKNRLVIFGEYIPFYRQLPFLKWFTPITGGFTPGTKPIPFETPDLGIKTAALICFEDVFPHLVRRYVQDDTDFLVNLTNDGWFGESSAQLQHAASAVFRSVENGRPLLRCCNNGLTCVVDEHGRIRNILHDAAGRIYGQGILTVTLALRSGESRPPPTFYTRHGDWFGWGCFLITLFQLAKCFGRCKWMVKHGDHTPS